MRIPMNPGVFADLMPKGAELYKKPELPKVRYKKNGVEYEISDLTLLNPNGILTFTDIVAEAARDGETVEVSYTIPPDMDDNKLKIIIDIVTGVSYSAKKKGRNGWSVDGGYLAYGCKNTTNESGRIITFFLDPGAVKHLAEYAKGRKEINLYEAIEYHISEWQKEGLKFLSKEEKK